MEATLILGTIGALSLLLSRKKLAAEAPAGLDRAGVLALIYQTGARFGVDPDLMAAFVEKESNYNPRAINPSDPSYGLGQIQKFWFEHFGYSTELETMLDPATNLEVMARVLLYFQGRTNPRTFQQFAFPQDADIYNVGETLWSKGTRNLSYRNDVQQKFERIKSSR